MSENQEYGLSELDTAVYKFLEENKDTDLTITIAFMEDLGLRVEVMSEGSVARSGDSISITEALLRLLPKAETRISEYKAAQAEVAALFQDEGDEDL